MVKIESRRRAAEPFLKWAGGKRQILPAILERIPSEFNTYYEPFLGGGAVFFAVAASRTFRRAVLRDRNADLVDAYLGVRDELPQVIRRLETLRRHHSEEQYYRIREQDPAGLSPAARAARIIYLNRTCYNGLYRVNRSGQFNVPLGRYKNPKILDAENLGAVSQVLQEKQRLAVEAGEGASRRKTRTLGVSIRVLDFEKAVAGAEPGDVIYFDPPYMPVSRTASFTAYHHREFGIDEQQRLAKLMRELRDRGVYALLSNADVPQTRKLYEDLPSVSVQARRAINSKPDQRGNVSELLVWTGPF
jgi:DNA adenine methylase